MKDHYARLRFRTHDAVYRLEDNRCMATWTKGGGWDCAPTTRDLLVQFDAMIAVDVMMAGGKSRALSDARKEADHGRA